MTNVYFGFYSNHISPGDSCLSHQHHQKSNEWVSFGIMEIYPSSKDLKSACTETALGAVANQFMQDFFFFKFHPCACMLHIKIFIIVWHDSLGIFSIITLQSTEIVCQWQWPGTELCWQLEVNWPIHGSIPPVKPWSHNVKWISLYLENHVFFSQYRILNRSFWVK